MSRDKATLTAVALGGYRADDIRLRVCSSDDIKTLLDGAPADLRLIAQLTLESLGLDWANSNCQQARTSAYCVAAQWRRWGEAVCVE